MSRKVGAWGESLAIQYLKRQGCRVVCTNYQCRMGEIDLVIYDNAQHLNQVHRFARMASTFTGKRPDAILVFVEVRFRRQTAYGSGAATITLTKQRKLVRTAQHYLKRYRQSDAACRFDVIDITLDAGGEPSIRWIKNAFESYV